MNYFNKKLVQKRYTYLNRNRNNSEGNYLKEK